MNVKTFLSVIIFFLLATTCFSQQEMRGMKPPSIEERLKMVNEKICEPLNLDEVQKEKVASAFKEFFIEMDKLMEDNSNRPPMPERSKVEPLEKIRNEKVKLLIPDTLFSKYLKLELAGRPKGPDQKRPEKEVNN